MLVVLSRDSGSNAREWGLGRGLDGWSGSRYKVFQRRCFKGVPDRWRRAVWGLMIAHKGEEERGPSLDSLVQDYWVRTISLFEEEKETDDERVELSQSSFDTGHPDRLGRPADYQWSRSLPHAVWKRSESSLSCLACVWVTYGGRRGILSRHGKCRRWFTLLL